jgi:hypothetical protein
MRKRTVLLTLALLAAAMCLPGQWVPQSPPPPEDLPQIQNPTQQAPDGGTQLNSLATGAAQRRLIQAQTEALRLANQQRLMDIQAEAERRKAASATIPPAQDQDNSRTWGSANGRYWTVLDFGPKMAYIQGFVDAASAAQSLDSAANTMKMFPWGLNNSEIIKSLDRFYGTPENARIPIGMAFFMCRERLDGVAEAVVEKHILGLRADVGTGR